MLSEEPEDGSGETIRLMTIRGEDHARTLILKEGCVHKKATGYLKSLQLSGRSDSCIQQYAQALVFYLRFLCRFEITEEDVLLMDYEAQALHFSSFLDYVRSGRHRQRAAGHIRNRTCNTYLRKVFSYYRFREKKEGKNLKVLSRKTVRFENAAGLPGKRKVPDFQGHLRQEKTEKHCLCDESCQILLSGAGNARDRAIIRILAETGCTLAELSRVNYCRDIDYENNRIRFSAGREKERWSYVDYRTTDLILTLLTSMFHTYCRTENLMVSFKTASPLSSGRMRRILYDMKKRTGQDAGQNSLRNYYIEQRKNAGWDMPDIARSLAGGMERKS